MSASNTKVGGVVLIVVGIGTVLFGGSTRTGGYDFTIGGIEFGTGKYEPMSRGQSLFWGVGMIALGIYLVFFDT
jgi:hypothetical protein